MDPQHGPKLDLVLRKFLEASWRRLGGVLGASWGVLVAYWGVSRRLVASRGVSSRRLVASSGVSRHLGASRVEQVYLASAGGDSTPKVRGSPRWKLPLTSDRISGPHETSRLALSCLGLRLGERIFYNTVWVVFHPIFLFFNLFFSDLPSNLER